MVKVLFVIAIGVAVGVAIELALAWRQRSRLVVLDEPDLPPGVEFERDPPLRRRRRPRIEARDAAVVFDDEGGFRILGPVAYDDALARPWDGGAGGTGADH